MGFSTNTTTYTGGVQTFPTGFALGFLQEADVKVYVVGNLDGLGDQIYSNFSFNSAAEILVTDVLTISDLVVVERTVSKETLAVDLTVAGSATRLNLDRISKQSMMAIHEFMDGRIDSLPDDHPAAAAATAAAASAALTAADVLLTNADVIATNADVVSTNADAALASNAIALTAADAAQTALDRIATNADVLSTNADVLLTAADVLATNADALTTSADVLLTNADVVLTAADAVATAADRVQTGIDAAAAATFNPALYATLEQSVMTVPNIVGGHNKAWSGLGNQTHTDLLKGEVLASGMIVNDTDFGDCYEFNTTGNVQFGNAYPVPYEDGRVLQITARVKVQQDSVLNSGNTRMQLGISTQAGLSLIQANHQTASEDHAAADGIITLVSRFSNRTLTPVAGVNDLVITTGSNRAWLQIRQNAGGVSDGKLRVGDFIVEDVTEVVNAEETYSLGLEAWDGGSDPTIWEHSVDGDTAVIETPTLLAGYEYRAIGWMTSDATNRNNYIEFYRATAADWISSAAQDLSNVTAARHFDFTVFDPADPSTHFKVANLSQDRPTIATVTFGAVGDIHVPLNINTGSATPQAVTKFKWRLNAGTHKDGIVKLYRRKINV